MTLQDKTDAELVELVLEELPSAEEFTYRERALMSPTSRGTLERWDKGEREIRKRTYRKVFIWLVERGYGDATDRKRAEELRRIEKTLEARRNQHDQNGGSEEKRG